MAKYTREQIMSLINYERHRQNTLHPEWLEQRALAVLTEEFLEVVQEFQKTEKDKDAMLDEMIQTAAVIFRILEEGI